MTGTVVGGIAEFFVGWLIAAARTRFTYLGGHYGMFEGPGCLATILIEVVCAGIGAAVGTFLLQ
jgi:hypothetical protein